MEEMIKCEQFEEEVCTSRFKTPYVCNGCSEVKKCTLTKTIYDAMEAQRKASEKISQSRSGILSTEGAKSAQTAGRNNTRKEA